jgi:signal transduction histidine kinase
LSEEAVPIATNDERYLATLQRLLEIPATDLKTALTHAADALTVALSADKVDAFIFDASRDSLVAVGTSTQPLSALERQLGLDVLPLSNGGRAVDAYKSGRPFRCGNVQDDDGELRGIKEGLKVRSVIAVPLDSGDRRRGVVLVSSLKPDFFSEADAAFVGSAAKWVASVAERAELIEQIRRTAIEQSRQSTAEELITILAHDLRNYVQPVIWRIHALKLRATTVARDSDLADIEGVLGTLSRLVALVSNLLDTARLDSGVYALDLQPVDLVLLLEDAATDLSSTGHAINVRSAQPIVVAADPVRLRQCIDNLLANALAHSPEGAPVHVSADTRNSERGACACVEIIDEGAGIPESMLPHVFDKFFTANAGRGGFGLGLYIAKRIASAHGGDLSADRYAGKGARFTLRLPLAPPA